VVSGGLFNQFIEPVDDSHRSMDNSHETVYFLKQKCYFELKHFNRATAMKQIRPILSILLALLFAGSGYVLGGVAPDVDEEGAENPETFVLFQNYPNPFNPTTTIKFEIKTAQQISIKVYDLLAREVAVLENGYKEVGVYEITFDARELPSGIYFYSLETKNARVVRQMTLMK